MFTHSTNSGQVTVVGVILLIAIGITLTGVYVSDIVPDTQEQQEFDNNQQVENQLRSLAGRLSISSATDSIQQVTVSTNIDYSGSFLVPLPQPLLQTTIVDQHDITINGSSTYTTTSDVTEFSPNYNRYQSQSTIRLGQQIYEYTGSQSINPTPQTLINDTNINVYKINGVEATKSTITFSVVPEGTSTINNINNSNGEVRITVETDLSDEKWRQLLEEELVENGGHIENVIQDSESQVEIVLGSGVSYSFTRRTIDIRSN